MARRISHSLLDPWITPPVKRLYRYLPIPRAFPPEGIILVGHLLAITAAIGFAYSTRAWWGGVLIALGVAGNHISDMLDGTHARATGQCRNGGELLDHFTDPLSFSYWVVGWCISCQRLDLGLASLIILFATAVLTNIKAKMIGQFTLAAFGPTEFKTLLVAYGILLSLITGGWIPIGPAPRVAYYCLVAMLVVGCIQLVVNLVRAVREVNAQGAPADTSDWQMRGEQPTHGTGSSGASTDGAAGTLN